MTLAILRAVRRLVRTARGNSRRGVRAAPCWVTAWRIDPTGHELRAPCDGEVISVAAARHAVALRTAGGAEILVHVGIDTVGLGGEGFELRVRKGDRVRAGDLLLTLRPRPGGAQGAAVS